MFVLQPWIFLNVKYVLLDMKFLIKYYSIGGNTEAVANMIEKYIIDQGHSASVTDIYNQENIEEYDFIFIGSMTIGNGNVPPVVREYLKWLLTDNHFNLPSFSVFGTGDTQWTYYCRAVDEIKYHICKKAKVVSTLKIEQHPINQKDKVAYYLENTFKEINK